MKKQEPPFPAPVIIIPLSNPAHRVKIDFHPTIQEQSSELITAFAELSKTKSELQEYIRGFQQIMFQATHNVRQPVANLIGISNMLEQQELTNADLKKTAGYIRQSVASLDIFTRDLIMFISSLPQSKKD